MRVKTFAHYFLSVGDRYVVADCGGGTVDLTVHQIEQPQGTLKELYKASGTQLLHPEMTKIFDTFQKLQCVFQAVRTVQSGSIWPSKPCCARSSARTSFRASKPSGRRPGWTSWLRSRRGNEPRRQEEQTPWISPCPSLSSTSTRDTEGRVWRPPWGGASE